MIVDLKKINGRIYAVLGVSIAFVSAILIGSHALYVKRNLEKIQKEESARLSGAFYSITQNLTDFYRFRAAANANSPHVKEAIRFKDTAALKKSIENRWAVLKQENKRLAIMQIHSKDGSSIIRLHEPTRYGDNLKDVRNIVKKIHETTEEQNGIEKGKYGLAYRMLYPVTDGGEYIGAVEFGVSLEYIADALKKTYGIPSGILIKESVLGENNSSKSGDFGEFRAIASHISKEELKALAKETASDTAQIELNGKGYFLQAFALVDASGENIGKIVVSQDLTDEYSYLKSMLIVSMFLVLSCGAVATFALGRYLQNSVKLVEMARRDENEQAKYLKTVLDSQQSIIVVTDGFELFDANMKFFEFLSDFSGLDEFKRAHRCVCELFIEEDGFLKRGGDNDRWVDMILAYPDERFKAKIADSFGNIHIFEVFAAKTELKGGVKIVVTFDDVTLSEQAKAALKEKAAQDETIAIQSSKLAAIGEMSALIAHQWRQPLSALSIMVQDVKAAYDYDEMDDAYVESFVKKSREQIEYMSKTIETFREFIKPDTKEGSFGVRDATLKSVELVESAFRKSGVTIEVQAPKEYTIKGGANEFKQAVINLLKNGKDAILENYKDGVIVVSIGDTEAGVKISVEDSGGGIADPSKLFCEYYTTKQKEGTGLGLFMTKKIIEKLGGSIRGYNKEPHGAVFEIEFKNNKAGG